MATDKLFYDFVIRFPDALPALLGITAPAGFRGLSVNVKDTELRNDVVLIPKGVEQPRLLIEFQGYQDPWILHRVVAEAGLYGYKEKYTGTLHLVVVFTRDAFARELEPVRWQLEHG